MGTMIAKSIGIVICRVGAVLLLAEAFRHIGFVLTPFGDLSGFSLAHIVRIVLTAAAPIVGAVILWIFAEQICSIGLNSHDVPTEMQVTGSDIVSAGTYLLGIYLIAFGIVGAVQFEVLWALPIDDESGGQETMSYMDASRISSRVAYAVQVIIGVFLLISGKKSR